MENKELKPCPFCGGKAAIVIGKYKHTYWIKCYNCGVETEAYDDSEDEDEGIKVWNRRVNENK